MTKSVSTPLYGDHTSATIEVEDWYREPAQLPIRDLADAYRRLSDPSTLVVADDDETVEWRMHNYRMWRCGWMAQMTRWRADAMHDHEHAIASALKLCTCLHDWERGEWEDRLCPVQKTGETGYTQRCCKCGEVGFKRTSYRNWAGD